MVKGRAMIMMIRPYLSVLVVHMCGWKAHLKKTDVEQRMSRREDEKRHVQFSSSLCLIQLTISSTLLMRILIDVRFHSTPFISRSIASDPFVRVNDSNRAQMEHREKERERRRRTT